MLRVVMLRMVMLIVVMLDVSLYLAAFRFTKLFYLSDFDPINFKYLENLLFCYFSF